MPGRSRRRRGAWGGWGSAEASFQIGRGGGDRRALNGFGRSGKPVGKGQATEYVADRLDTEVVAGRRRLLARQLVADGKEGTETIASDAGTEGVADRKSVG